MIHAYNEYMLANIQEKLGSIFELAILEEGIDIDKFIDIFLASPITKRIEEADFIIVEGKSADEILALILKQSPKYHNQNEYASPEYWTGYVLAYIQWFFNISFKEFDEYFGIKTLISCYFPYHEMDITHLLDYVKKSIPIKNTLKTLRVQHNLSQNDLAILSNVPIRNIRAYEQGKQDIAKASAETLYALSKVLDCSIEKLINAN